MSEEWHDLSIEAWILFRPMIVIARKC